MGAHNEIHPKDRRRSTRRASRTEREGRLGWKESSPLCHVDFGLFTDQVRVSSADTFDGGQGEHDLVLSVNIGVKETQNVLEASLIFGNDDGLLGLRLVSLCG